MVLSRGSKKALSGVLKDKNKSAYTTSSESKTVKFNKVENNLTVLKIVLTSIRKRVMDKFKRLKIS